MKIAVLYKKENEAAKQLFKKISSSIGSNLVPNVVDADYILTLGGDGTLIHSASKYANLGVPFIGINTGNLGFLTAADSADWKAALDNIFGEKVFISRRITLEVKYKKDIFWAINEVAIKGHYRVIKLKVKVGENELMMLSGDGLIVATQTGSTAYSLSAGGPIVAPELDSILLTPINPIGLPVPPFVLSNKDKIFLEVENGDDVYLVVDGKGNMKLSKGDKLDIKTGKNKVKFGYFDREYFPKALNSKFGLSRRLGV